MFASHAGLRPAWRFPLLPAYRAEGACVSSSLRSRYTLSQVQTDRCTRCDGASSKTDEGRLRLQQRAVVRGECAVPRCEGCARQNVT